MSTTRAIRTSTPQTACDVCGRTLLRGERAEVYLAGGNRQSVCELCTARALHGGWVREGTVPDYPQSGERVDRRRSLLRRGRRGRRDGASAEPEAETPPTFADDPPAADVDATGEPDPAAGGEFEFPGSEPERGSAPDWPETPGRSGRRGRRARRPAPLRASGDGPARPTRHVHAVPTSVEHRIEAAVGLFNDSEHPRTIAGITRSLGLPDVSVHPASPVAAIVNVVVAWELCWYRYEVDLSAESSSVRGAGQGYELSELTELEREANVRADERGALRVG